MMLNSGKIKDVALSIVELCLAEENQSVKPS